MRQPEGNSPVRRLGWLRLSIGLLVVAAAGCGSHGPRDPAPGPALATSPTKARAPTTIPVSHGPRAPVRSPSPPPWELPVTAAAAGQLRPGSNPNVLPTSLLVADKLNNRLIIIDPQGRVRWQFPRRGDLPRGQTFRIPDDAFFTPDGQFIVATEEDDFVIRVIDVARHAIVYQYGEPGAHGSGPNRLWNPDDAIMLPDGNILTADIKNQRILLIGHGQHTVLRQWGETGHGYHHPPDHYGAPNGVFPMSDGHFLVTEIRGDWVDSIDLAGHVSWTAHPPGIDYPSDSNEVRPGRYLTVDYSRPGQMLIFDRNGRAVWRYKPSGAQALDHPSLALPLPNGDVVCTDDANHRVIVVDPRTNTIVWQYGHTGVPGAAPGFLDNPDGVDLVPPYSLIGRAR
jgi:hypothetical protein